MISDSGLLFGPPCILRCKCMVHMIHWMHEVL